MTLKDKVKIEDPNSVDEDEYKGGVFGCPADYAFLNCSDCSDNCAGESEKNCAKCWRQEYIDPSTLPDNVNHPSHYQGKHECIDEMIKLFGVRAVIDFCKCNVYKYRYRADRKGGEEDIKKAEWYMDKIFELEEGRHKNDFSF